MFEKDVKQWILDSIQYNTSRLYFFESYVFLYSIWFACKQNETWRTNQIREVRNRVRCCLFPSCWLVDCLVIQNHWNASSFDKLVAISMIDRLREKKTSWSNQQVSCHEETIDSVCFLTRTSSVDPKDIVCILMTFVSCLYIVCPNIAIFFLSYFAVIWSAAYNDHTFIFVIWNANYFSVFHTSTWRSIDNFRFDILYSTRVIHG